MDYAKFETNVQNYTTAVKEKMLIINGTAVAIDNKVEDVKSDISTLKSDVSALDSSFRVYVDEHSETHSLFEKEIENIDASIVSLIDSDTTINSSISSIKTDVNSLKTTLGNSGDASTENSIYGLIAALRADFEAYELITATALTDISARLDAVNIA